MLQSLIQSRKEDFINRHIGPSELETKQMLESLGLSSMEELISKTVPNNIRLANDLDVSASMSESVYLKHIHALGEKNVVNKSLKIGRAHV